MANWKKLNEEFDNLLNNLSEEDWYNWNASREQNKRIRRDNIIIKAKLHESFLVQNVGFEQSGDLCKIGLFYDNDNKYHYIPPLEEKENNPIKNSPVVNGAIFF